MLRNPIYVCRKWSTAANRYLAHNVTGTHELQVPCIRYGYLETLLSLSLSLSTHKGTHMARPRGYKFRVLSRGIILK